MIDNPIAIKYIENQDKVLEWGSGESTHYWAKTVNTLVSIEHSHGWYDKIRQNLPSNVDYHYVPSHSQQDDDDLEQHVSDLLQCAGDPLEIDGKTFWNTRAGFDWHCGIEYIRKPFDIGHEDYDVIIVDGRCRVMCCYMASFFLKDGGYIVFDDFNNRTYYHGVLKYYEIIDSNGTIAILSPRKELLLNEEVKELSQKVYSDYENN